MTRKRNQIVALYMTPEEAYCVQELLNVKSAILSEKLKDFARGGDADELPEATVTMTDLDQCEELATRLHSSISSALQREAEGAEVEDDWLDEIFDSRN